MHGKIVQNLLHSLHILLTVGLFSSSCFLLFQQTAGRNQVAPSPLCPENHLRDIIKFIKYILYFSGYLEWQYYHTFCQLSIQYFFFFQSSLSHLCQSLLGLSGFFLLSSHQTKVTHFRPCNVSISLPDTKFYLPIAALKTKRERERERNLSKLNCLKQ